jgi:hypothetical protein
MPPKTALASISRQLSAESKSPILYSLVLNEEDEPSGSSTEPKALLALKMTGTSLFRTTWAYPKIEFILIFLTPLPYYLKIFSSNYTVVF